MRVGEANVPRYHGSFDCSRKRRSKPRRRDSRCRGSVHQSSDCSFAPSAGLRVLAPAMLHGHHCDTREANRSRKSAGLHTPES